MNSGSDQGKPTVFNGALNARHSIHFSHAVGSHGLEGAHTQVSAPAESLPFLCCWQINTTHGETSAEFCMKRVFNWGEI